MATHTDTIDRLAPRGRPEGTPLMHQTWENLLFMHWSFDPEIIRPHVPAGLELDTFDNKAWVGVTPFTIPDLRATGMPHIPGLSSFHELNVRSYVHRDGMPGIWFFSLDASKTLPVLGARLFYALRYLRAQIDFEEVNGIFNFKMRRLAGPEAEFEASWKRGMELRIPNKESLAFFLVERYCLYSADEQGLYRARIYHAPWQLREAELLSYRSTLLKSVALPEPTDSPLLHHADLQQVDVWASEEV